MPTYPSLRIHPDSRRIVRDGRDEQQATNGTTYVRKFYSADRYDFELRHEALTAADVTTLEAFYTANANATFDLVWPEDGLTYTSLRFGRNAYRTQWVSPGRRDVFVRLVG
jgi:hypothetical protein